MLVAAVAGSDQKRKSVPTNVKHPVVLSTGVHHFLRGAEHPDRVRITRPSMPSFVSNDAAQMRPQDCGTSAITLLLWSSGRFFFDFFFLSQKTRLILLVCLGRLEQWGCCCEYGPR